MYKTNVYSRLQLHISTLQSSWSREMAAAICSTLPFSSPQTEPPKYAPEITHVATPSWALGNQAPPSWTLSSLPPHLEMSRGIHGSKMSSIN